MFNRIQGGDDRNVEPGFNAWRDKIGANVIEYIPNSAKISEMVQTGEAALFPLTPTQVEVLKGKGVPVEYAQPKEGSVVLITAQCVVANTPDADLAQKLAEHLLAADSQSKLLEVAAQLPTNSKATATGAGAATLTQIAGYMKTAVAVDWDSINENRPKWNERWNKTIEK
jgi:putative spermidine/putrescine transport system substrate-binding protein